MCACVRVLCVCRVVCALCMNSCVRVCVCVWVCVPLLGSALYLLPIFVSGKSHTGSVLATDTCQLDVNMT